MDEEVQESANTCKEKVTSVIAQTVLENNFAEKLEVARNIPLSATEYTGKFNSSKGRSISINFTNKSDADSLLRRKKNLSDGIFVDKE